VLRAGHWWVAPICQSLPPSSHSSVCRPRVVVACRDPHDSSGLCWDGDHPCQRADINLPPPCLWLLDLIRIQTRWAAAVARTRGEKEMCATIESKLCGTSTLGTDRGRHRIMAGCTRAYSVRNQLELRAFLTGVVHGRAPRVGHVIIPTQVRIAPFVLPYFSLCLASSGM
jgi:hypothetical protein